MVRLLCVSAALSLLGDSRTFSEEPVQPATSPQPLTADDFKIRVGKAVALLAQGQGDKAREEYARIIAVDPTNAYAAAAHSLVAKSLVSEQKATEAEAYLASVLAKAPRLPPKETEQLYGELAALRVSLSETAARLRKFDEAISILQRTVRDRRMPAAAVRGALLLIARNHQSADRHKDAVAAFEQLLKLPPANDEQRVVDLVALVAIAPEKVDHLETFAQDRPAAAPELLARIRYEAARAHANSKATQRALETLDRLIAAPASPEAWVRLALIAKADLLLGERDVAGAITQYQVLLQRPLSPTPDALAKRLVDINRLVDLAPDGQYVTAVAEYLSKLPTLQGLSLSNAAPDDDVLVVGTAPNVATILERSKRHLRRTTGRVDPVEYEKVSRHVQSGSDARPFVVSDFSKAVAKKLSADAPLAGFLKPLLAGEYEQAIRFAWVQSRIARDANLRRLWLEAVALALRCEDQSRVGRVDTFWRWVTSTGHDEAAAVEKNPLAQDLGTDIPPREVSEEDLANAAARLSQSTRPTEFPFLEEIGRVLPDDDPFFLATRPIGPVLERYRLHLWRSQGRDLPSELAKVKEQLTRGGESRPFVVSPEAKRLAVAIAADAPLAGWLKPLLAGNYEEAAQYAWTRARQTPSDAESADWLGAIGLALRLAQQSYRSETEWLQWVSAPTVAGEPKPEQAAKWLSLEPVKFVVDEKARQRVLAALDTATVATLPALNMRDVLPGNDILLAATRPLPEVLAGFRQHVRRTDGRVVPSKLKAAEAQLRGVVDPANGNVFETSPESKQLASQISDRAPLKPFLQPLLNGESQRAAGYAWRQAKGAKDDATYAQWVTATALAIRAHDQSLRGRVDEFLEWTAGTLVDDDGKPIVKNPLAEYLEGK